MTGPQLVDGWAHFIAFAVDINGTALARYDLAATENEAAEQEARQYLQHQPGHRSLGRRPPARCADRQEVDPRLFVFTI